MLVNEPRVVNAAAERRPGERWLYGINAIARRLEVDPGSVLEVRLLPGPSSRRAAVARLAEAASVPVREAGGGVLRRLTGTDSHQGAAARAGAFKYASLGDVMGRSVGHPLLVLDRVQDPQNLGALVRTAAAAGMACVIIPRRGAVGVTPTVEKAAAGAVNDTPICQVTNLCRTLRGLGSQGYWSIALVPRGGRDLFDLELPGAVVLVLGGESGMRPLVEGECDLRASIPAARPVESLNVSVAGAIAMYEVARRLGRLDSR